MNIYLVGGAVRDALLGRPVSERDWVVVGATVAEMEALGYRQVGRDFPVFLHPETHDEYALARTERKTGPGHQGFEVHADPSVTLEDDLVRRDLTINAMAQSAEGELIDPFAGVADLKLRMLRHVSDAFAEDPLRVFRVARFAAVLPGFEVASETRQLMTDMAVAGALAELSAERVWAELVKALAGEAPQRFLEVLVEVSALDPWLPEFEGTTPIPPLRSLSGPESFAAFVSGLSEAEVQSLTARLKAPRAHTRLALWIVRNAEIWRDWRQADPDALMGALGEVQAFKPENGLEQAMRVAASLGGVGSDDLLEGVRLVREEVDVASLQAQGLSGRALGEALTGARRDRLLEPRNRD